MTESERDGDATQSRVHTEIRGDAERDEQRLEPEAEEENEHLLTWAQLREWVAKTRHVRAYVVDSATGRE